MKIISWNVNGLRAVARKNELQHLLRTQRPDILMLQETKGSAEQFEPLVEQHPDYRQYYSSADKKGYAGTSVWASTGFLQAASDVEFAASAPAIPNADEGRVAHLSLQHGGEAWDLFCIYFPNGGKSEQAWVEKLVFYDRIHDYMNQRRHQGRIVVVGGDMNVAHTEIDIARPKDNDGKIGFHPKERAWMDRLIADDWSDVWRSRNPGVTDQYSWWHLLSRGRERNVGWRIDYFLMAQNRLDRVGEITYLHAQMGSDHCPLSMVLT